VRRGAWRYDCASETRTPELNYHPYRRRTAGNKQPLQATFEACGKCRKGCSDLRVSTLSRQSTTALGGPLRSGSRHSRTSPEFTVFVALRSFRRLRDLTTTTALQATADITVGDERRQIASAARLARSGAQRQRNVRFSRPRTSDADPLDAGHRRGFVNDPAVAVTAHGPGDLLRTDLRCSQRSPFDLTPLASAFSVAQ
jgi:hypothetical protein